MEHLPVLLNETVSALVHDADGIYVDCTFGRGGHSREILAQLSQNGRLWVFDQDERAIEAANELAAMDSRVTVVDRNFKYAQSTLADAKIDGRVSGLLADFGVSSPQLDDAMRGFSFRFDAPLDMRMDQRQSLTAAQVVATAAESELADIFYHYGEERKSRRIAKAIVTSRAEAPILTTLQLADLVKSCLPRSKDGKHPATRVFQALRIHVNQELEAVDSLLGQLSEILAPGGIAALISFHSLEDRRVKQFFRRPVEDAQRRHLPQLADQQKWPWELQGKAVKAGREELSQNPRASSAVLRVARFNP